MNNISIKLDPRKVVSNFNKLAAEFPRATASAINKTATQAFNAGKKEIRDEYNIKTADLNSAMKIQKASQNYLMAKILGLGRSLGLIKFGAVPSKKGVRVKIKRSSAKITVPHSFISVMKSGHKGVFLRKTKARLPIEEKYTIGVASMLRAEKIKTRIIDYFHNNFARIFKHEIEWFLTKK